MPGEVQISMQERSVTGILLQVPEKTLQIGMLSSTQKTRSNGLRFARKRKPNGKDASLAKLAFDADFASVGVNNRLADGKT